MAGGYWESPFLFVSRELRKFSPVPDLNKNMQVAIQLLGKSDSG